MRTLILPIALALTALACNNSREPTGMPPSVAPAAEQQESSGHAASAPARPSPAAAAPSVPSGTLQTTAAPPSTPPTALGTAPVVRIETSMGTIRARLDPGHAPQTVANFVQYANDHFYDGTIFHRVIRDFMVQGGGFEPGMRRKPTRAPIALEISPALRHVDGAIAMARTSDPNSATAQFYICDGAQHRLDDGYAPFGVTIEGMDVVRRIAQVQTGPGDQPLTDVVIRSVRMEP